MVVVLPAPLGPISPKISPSNTSNDTSSTATVFRYVFRNPETRMTGCGGVVGVMRRKHIVGRSGGCGRAVESQAQPRCLGNQTGASSAASYRSRRRTVRHL